MCHGNLSMVDASSTDTENPSCESQAWHMASEENGRSTSRHLFSPAEWERLATRLQLPHRQAEILDLLIRGFSDPEITSRLSIELPTVRTHLGRMFERFGVRDRTSLVVEVFRAFRDLERI